MSKNENQDEVVEDLLCQTTSLAPVYSSSETKSLKIQVKKSSKPVTVSDSWWRHWDRDNPRKFAQTPHTRYYWRLAGDTLVLPLKWVCNTLNGFGIIDLTSSLLNLIETSLHLWWMISAAIPARPAFEEGSRTGSLTMIFGFQLTDFLKASLCSSAPNFDCNMRFLLWSYLWTRNTACLPLGFPQVVPHSQSCRSTRRSTWENIMVAFFWHNCRSFNSASIQLPISKCDCNHTVNQRA